MFSEAFFETMKKAEKAYKAQNVSEIIRRGGRIEKTVITAFAFLLALSGILCLVFFDTWICQASSIAFASLAFLLSSYLRKVMNSENILFYKNHGGFENAADYFIKNLEDENVAPELYGIIEEYYAGRAHRTQSPSGLPLYFSMILVPVLVSFLCDVKGNIFMLTAACAGFLVVPGLIEFILYAADSERRTAENISAWLRYTRLNRMIWETQKKTSETKNTGEQQ